MSIFNQSYSSNPKKNKFDLSHDKKLSLQFAKLVPILLQEVLPGDRMRVNTEIMMRLAPMVAPIMHRCNVYIHYFFVPNRIIWNEWEDFITGGKDGTAAPIAPYFMSNNVAGPGMGTKSLSDYFGLPTLTAPPTEAIKINALPFRAYMEIFNEYYRDQTLTAERVFGKGSGEITGAELATLTTIQNRAWEKDYFTSALPWAQRGPEIGIPLSYKSITDVKVASTGLTQAGALSSLADGKAQVGASDARFENLDLTESTINNLRKATRLQEWLEKNARGGARYVEQLLSHFGKAPKDARLQRPEYLGGGKQPIVISEVLNTAGSTTLDLEPVGEMSGHGISVGSSAGFKREFEEHGFVLGIMSAIPRTGYMDGVHKMWSRFDKLDYAWPEFAQLGEQEILNKELYYTATSTNTGATFGYTPRYSEYKYGCSTVHGEFKTTLDFWHLGRKFAAPPVLNEGFITCTPADTKRIFAVTDPDTDDLYCQVYHNIDAIRPLPYYNVPRL